MKIHLIINKSYNNLTTIKILNKIKKIHCKRTIFKMIYSKNNKIKINYKIKNYEKILYNLLKPIKNNFKKWYLLKNFKIYKTNYHQNFNKC